MPYGGTRGRPEGECRFRDEDCVLYATKTVAEGSATVGREILAELPQLSVGERVVSVTDGPEPLASQDLVLMQCGRRVGSCGLRRH